MLHNFSFAKDFSFILENSLNKDKTDENLGFLQNEYTD